MESKNNEQKENIIEDLQFKKFYMVGLESGAFISGMLIAKNEQLIDGEVKNSYRFLFGNAKYVNLYEEEIVSVQLIDPTAREDYFANFELDYDVKCLDDKNNVLPSDVILGSVIFKKAIWDNLLESEKRGLISQLQLNPEEIVEFINILVNYKNDNAKLYDKKEAEMKAIIEFLDKYEKIKEMFPSLKEVVKFIYKESGIEKLINTIA